MTNSNLSEHQIVQPEGELETEAITPTEPILQYPDEENWDTVDPEFDEIEEDSDDALIPISEMIGNMTQFIGQSGDPEIGQVYTVEQLNFDLPIELQIEIDEEGRLTLKAAPPTQKIETTVMPVFHQIKLSVVRDNEW